MSEYPPGPPAPPSGGVPSRGPVPAAREWSIDDDDDLAPQPAPTGPLADDAFLLAYARDHDLACPACGYNLRMLSAPRCPECGRALRLGVSLASPPLAGWLAVAIPVLLSAGVGVVIGLLYAARGSPGRRYQMFMLAATYFWLMIPAAVLVVVFRRALMRAPAGVKATLSAVAIGLGAAALAVMFKRF